MAKKTKLESNVCIVDKLTTGTLRVEEDEAYAADASSMSLRIIGVQNNDINNSSPDIAFQRDPANGNCLVDNYVMEMHFAGRNDAGNIQNFGSMNCIVKDPADDGEKGSIIFTVADGDGAPGQALAVRGGTALAAFNNVQVKNGPLIYAIDAGTGIIPAFTADDTTPSVAGGNLFNTVANSTGTAITALDNGLVGQMVVIRCGHLTNAVTIPDSGNFIIAGAWEPNGVGETITLVKFAAGNSWTEISRSDNA